VPIIRPALPDDANAIARVHVETWQSAYRGLVADSILDALEVERRATSWRIMIERKAASTGIFVAEEGGAIVGLCSCGRSRKDDSGLIGEVYAIYVRPDAAGSGVGRALLLEAERNMTVNGFAGATLQVLEANAMARGFYEHMGWRDTGEREDRLARGGCPWERTSKPVVADHRVCLRRRTPVVAVAGPVPGSSDPQAIAYLVGGTSETPAECMSSRAGHFSVVPARKGGPGGGPP
jgi:ribosomal protein S18 acetylase RimI-like enzyme